MRVEASKDHRYRVHLDGVDVSHDCYFADDEAGVVGLLVRDHSGRVVFDASRDGVARIERSGVVTIERAE